MENNKNQFQKNPSDYTSEELESLLSQLTTNQIRFVVARQECATDKEAAEAIGIKPTTVYHWKSRDGKPIDEVVQAMMSDGLVTALHIRKRNLVKAMLVKVAGLDSNNETIRQKSSTEIIEWETGKASQQFEHTGKDGGPIEQTHSIDLSKLTDDDLDRLEQIAQRVAR